MTPVVDPLRSVLRLFLSVDIVGSTAFKQRSGSRTGAEARIKDGKGTGNSWFSPFAGFFREVERLFAQEWRRYSEVQATKHSWPTGDRPELWKGVGDEVIYTKILSDHREALCCLQCWMRAVLTYRDILRSSYPSLDLKATAWLAGFPIGNSEIVFRSKLEFDEVVSDDDDPLFMNMVRLEEYYAQPYSGEFTRDFIGPSIDTGFRLSALATPRKLVVSVELALLLASAFSVQPRTLDLEPIHLFYDGRIGLKGVLGGAPYPVFWVDMLARDELSKAEDAILQRSPLPTDKIRRFCEEFIDRSSQHLSVPYVVGNPDASFGSVPTEHQLRLTKIRDYYKNESEKREGEKRSQSTLDVSGESLSAGSKQDFLAKLRDISVSTQGPYPEDQWITDELARRSINLRLGRNMDDE